MIRPDGGIHSNHPINGSRSSLTKNDMGLSTIIGKANRDASGKLLEQDMMLTVGRMRKLDRRIIDNTGINGNLIVALDRLDKLKDNLAVSDTVAEMAAHIYRKAWKSGVVRHRYPTPYVAVAMYAACKYTSTLRTIEEIAKASNISRKKFQKAYTRFVLDMDMKVPQIDTIQCVARIASNASITERTKRYAIKILNETMGHDDLVSRRPISLAVAALYLACVKNGDGKTWQDIAEAANCGTMHISKTAKILNNLINI